jgi:uncharacterized membrane protein YeaQ/YmgE (transglycosylase-associated protein family)
MRIMVFLIWLALGAVAGFFGSRLFNRDGANKILDVALGVVGAVVCGYAGTLMGIGGVSGANLMSLLSAVVAVVGALAVLAVYRSVAAHA